MKFSYGPVVPCWFRCGQQTRIRKSKEIPGSAMGNGLIERLASRLKTKTAPSIHLIGFPEVLRDSPAAKPLKELLKVCPPLPRWKPIINKISKRKFNQIIKAIDSRAPGGLEKEAFDFRAWCKATFLSSIKGGKIKLVPFPREPDPYVPQPQKEIEVWCDRCHGMVKALSHKCLTCGRDVDYDGERGLIFTARIPHTGYLGKALRISCTACHIGL